MMAYKKKHFFPSKLVSTTATTTDGDIIAFNTLNKTPPPNPVNKATGLQNPFEHDLQSSQCSSQ